MGVSSVMMKQAIGANGNLYLYGFGGSLKGVIENIADGDRDPVWSAFKAGRVVTPTQNSDEGFYTFRDAVEYHSTEVFSTLTLPSSFHWVDEQTMKITAGYLTLHLSSGWAAEFGAGGNITILDSDKADFVKSLGELTLLRLQHSTESGSTVYADGASGTVPFTHTEANPRIENEVVRTETVSYELLPEGTTEYRILYSNDRLDTEENEQRWLVQRKGESWERWLWLGPKEGYADQQSADEKLDEILAERLRTDNQLIENKRMAEAQARTEERSREQDAERDAAEARKEWVVYTELLRDAGSAFTTIESTGSLLTSEEALLERTGSNPNPNETIEYDPEVHSRGRIKIRGQQGLGGLGEAHESLRIVVADGYRVVWKVRAKVDDGTFATADINERFTVYMEGGDSMVVNLDEGDFNASLILNGVQQFDDFQTEGGTFSYSAMFELDFVEAAFWMNPEVAQNQGWTETLIFPTDPDIAKQALDDSIVQDRREVFAGSDYEGDADDDDGDDDDDDNRDDSPLEWEWVGLALLAAVGVFVVVLLVRGGGKADSG